MLNSLPNYDDEGIATRSDDDNDNNNNNNNNDDDSNDASNNSDDEANECKCHSNSKVDDKQETPHCQLTMTDVKTMSVEEHKRTKTTQGQINSVVKHH